MKALLTTWLMVLCLFSQAQTTWTVSNNPDIPGQFGSIQAANDSPDVQPGDVLLVSRSAGGYGNPVITKRLTILGEGYNTEKEYSNSLVARFTDLDLRSGSSGTEIRGFYIQRIYADNQDIEDIIVRNNRFTIGIELQGYRCRNWLIQQNVFDSFSRFDDGINDGQASSNFIVKNNIFGQDGVITNFTNAGIIITHNVFVAGVNDKRSVIINSFGTILTNNIFVNRSFSSALSDNIYSNNIVFQAGGDLDLIALDQNNLDADPLFANWDMQVSPIATPIVPPYDFRVTDGSPAIDAATDGEDIGLTSDVVPYQNPFIPYVTRVSVLNPEVPQNGSLNVQLRVQYPSENE